MIHPTLEKITSSARHTTFYLSCGPVRGALVIFVHGWPELSVTWRHQLSVLGSMGFHAIAPDMRGYGRSSAPGSRAEYAVENAVLDMCELLDHLGVERAIWVGHDWGSPVVWSLAQHHPDRCHGVVSLCAPYLPDGFALQSLLPHVDRSMYPEATFPLGQWAYFRYHLEAFDAGVASFEADLVNTVRLLFRSGVPEDQARPSSTAFTLERGGFFGRRGRPPSLQRDPSVLTEVDESRYVAALSRTGFRGPNSWYCNDEANLRYAASARGRIRIDLPVLFLHAAWDPNCDTVKSTLADPMRGHCSDLEEVVLLCGHWMAEEKPAEVNAAIARWLARRFSHLWTAKAATGSTAGS